MLDPKPLSYEEWLKENEAALIEEWMDYRFHLAEETRRHRHTVAEGPSWYNPDEE